MLRWKAVDHLASRAERQPRVAEQAATLALSSALTLALFWPSLRSLTSPTGPGDALAHYATGFAGRTNTHLGYPFGMSAFPYFPSTDLTQRALATSFQWLTGDRFLSVNMVWVLSFPLTALAAWWVFRLAGAARALAVALAVSFSFIPYHVFRGLDHIYLAAMWSVPVAVGLALLTGRGEIPLLLSSPGWRRKAALGAGCLVVAWSGIYYAFFSCLLMTVALTWLFAGGATRRDLVRSAAPLGLVVASVMTPLVSAAIANHADPPTALVANRQPHESARYAGSLAFALTPSPLTDVPLVGNRSTRFDAYVQPDLEGYGYGQFGTLVSTLSAALLLPGLVALARRRMPADRSHEAARRHGPGLYVALLATSLLFFVPWSLNFSFALLVTPEIRAWDRLLPFILLLSMAGAVSLVRELAPRGRRAWQGLSAGAIVLLTLLDGVTPYAGVIESRLRAGDRQMRSGTDYADRVNEAVPGACGVLQLPYVPFPERPTEIGAMGDYEHFLVALTNPEKRWSYGGVKYTTASRWAAQLDDDLTEGSVASLVEGGFCGVHLDRVGYGDSRAVVVAASLERLLGPAAAEGLGGRWQFFEMPTGVATHDVRNGASLTPAAERFFYPPNRPVS